MKTILSIFAVVAFASPLAHATAPTADQIPSPAKDKAAAEHKAIFVHFGASWCGWCMVGKPHRPIDAG